MRRYGAWTGIPKGYAENKARCVVETPMPGGYLYKQCSRKRGHGTGEYEGLLCAQHAKMQAAGRHLSIPKDEEGS